MGEDLIAFFARMVDDDEAAALEAASALPPSDGYGWTAVHRYPETHPASGESFIVDASSELVARAASARSYDRAVADHIARHDPARVLREVAAKRAILAAHVPQVPKYGHDIPRCAVCLADRARYPDDWQGDPWPCETVRHVVASWDDHPDYQPKWAIAT